MLKLILLEFLKMNISKGEWREVEINRSTFLGAKPGKTEVDFKYMLQSCFSDAAFSWMVALINFSATEIGAVASK